MTRKDEMQKELKELKINSSLNPQAKEQMKSAIKKHARKKQKRKKFKAAAIWASTVAALFLAGILVLHMIDNNQSALPADNHDKEESNTRINDKQPVDSSEEPGFSVREGEKESKFIRIEGMEEEVTVTNYTLEPYGIHYQMEEFLNNYQVENHAVRYYTDAENAWIRLEITENTILDETVSYLQSQYTGNFSYREEPAETPQEENRYEGVSQHFSDPPQGYYAYQIEENVLIIQYEYIIEAGDGMGPRLQQLRESIEQRP
ncbi:hypothetical protein [Virgibacillus kimchii]